MIGNIKLIGAIAGGMYGVVALTNYWFDLYDILIYIGFVEIYPNMNQIIIVYQMTILLHATLGYILGYLVQLFVNKYKKSC